ncbi:MAG: conserved rane protein of unknown function [Acidobacteria bacterium]|nr:conserved rane protein of unknown function [Acidobacteriota bacterium]
MKLPPGIPLLLLAALAFPYFVHLGRSALWDTNETYYAETPREMLETGDYVSPMFNYQPRTQKPPLTYWLVLLGYWAAGIGELGVRLPGAIAVAATILLVFAAARLFFSTQAALLAAAIVATTPRVFMLARKLPIDALLLFWLTGTAYFLMRALKNGSRRDWWLAYLFAGFGFLTKGPVAWVIPGLCFLAWSLWMRRCKPGTAHPLTGLLILALVVAPWYVVIYMRHGWTYIADFFLRDNIARFTAQNVGGWNIGPSRGFFYYAPVLLGDFFPWSLVAAAALACLWSERKSIRTEHALPFIFPLLWCATVFLFFSISRNKQEYYIAPAYPLLAVLMAGVADRLFVRARDNLRSLRRYWTVACLLVAAVFLAMSALSPLILPDFIPDGPPVLHYAPAVILACAAAVLLRLAARRRVLGSMVAITATLWLVSLLAAAVYLPAVEKLRPVKDLCREIEARAKPGDEIGYYRLAVPSMLFYLRRPIFSASNEDIMAHQFEGETRVFCIMGERDYGYFTGPRNLSLVVLSRHPQLPTQIRAILDRKGPSAEDLLLVSNRPDPGSGGRDARETR